MPTRVMRSPMQGSVKRAPKLVKNGGTVTTSREVKKNQVSKKRTLQHPGPVTAAVSKKRSIVAKKTMVTEGAEQLAKKNHLTRLERRSISIAVENQYAEYYQKFVSFCRGAGAPLPPRGSVDDILTDYLDVLFLEGKGVHEGEKTIASLEFQHIKLKGKLDRARKALRGWRKERPPESRIPMPKLIVYALAMLLLARRQRAMALKVMLDFDTYMRQGESLDLRRRHFVKPVKQAGPQYRWFSIIVRDFDDQQPDKVGVFDNSIPLDSVERVWLGEILNHHVQGLKDVEDNIFPFTMEQYRKEFCRAAKRLQMDGLHPYQLRHGGAADDLCSKQRDYPGVKQRGRWATDQSVRRYTKVGKVQQLLNRLPNGALEYCQWCHRNLEKVLRGQVQVKNF